MNLRQELEQLANDAKHPGAYQAKSAYAKFLLSGNPSEKEKQLAKSYLNEVIQNKNAGQYRPSAELSLNFEQKDKVKVAAINDMTDVHDNEEHFFRKMSESPQFQYRVICEELRQTKSDSYADLNKIISKFKKLLDHKELPDVLLAKIYFRLIHLHVICAQINGHRYDLEEAKRYCRLFNIPALYDMKQAINARQIYIEIEKGQLDSFEFEPYIFKAFDTGQEISRLFFKYAGVVLGSVLDVAMLLSLKPIDKDLIYGEKDRSVASYFKGSGIAGALKYVGKSFGKHVVGNIITGPLAVIFGVITYPFLSFYSKYKKEDENVKAVATNLFDLNQGEGVPQDEKNILQSTGVSLKKMFERPNAHKPIVATGKKGKIDKICSVKKEILTLHPSKERCAYGVVFANAKKIRKENAKDKKGFASTKCNY